MTHNRLLQVILWKHRDTENLLVVFSKRQVLMILQENHLYNVINKIKIIFIIFIKTILKSSYKQSFHF
jgi:hypothetical protein